MAQSLSRVFVHITFSTKNRAPIIGDEIKHELWAYIVGVCDALDCKSIRVGGRDDHVHVCCVLSKNITQVKLLEEIKKSSSKWIKTKSEQYANFYWQDGYGIFSVNPAEVERVVEYITNQDAHHEKRTFQEELVAFLQKYKVDYDERYLWS